MTAVVINLPGNKKEGNEMFPGNSKAHRRIAEQKMKSKVTESLHDHADWSYGFRDVVSTQWWI